MLVSAQCKTAGHGPCLFEWGEVFNTVWLRLQSFSVKVLAMILVYSSGGLGTQSGQGCKVTM